ncbi:hypothetical protein RJ639_028931 [Escallonia herrerae]|uniref:Transposase (putative) gypsy type domain-containing protein n=1 Tax=Escallonia herrerae TaxID=1293975 RepID=A0AA88X7X9_9ASTE|nr:hypothetical protein RJ639_028931 [Escallonia herrerae]
MGFCSDRICSAVVAQLGQSVRTGFSSDIIQLYKDHSDRAECSDEILLGQNSARPRSLCSGTVFEWDSVRTESARPCSAKITLFRQSVRKGFYSSIILLGRGHSAPAECSDVILFGQNSALQRSLCLGRVFGQDSARAEFYSAVVTQLGLSVQTGFCSGRILLGRGHSAPAECSNGILLRQNSALQRSLCSGIVFGRDSVRTESARPWSLCSGRVFRRDSVRKKFSSAKIILLEQSVCMGFCLDRIYLLWSLCSSIVFGLDSVRIEFNSAKITLFGQSVRTGFCSGRIRLGRDVKDQAEDKANPKPWYTADEKSSKMSAEDLQELIREYPLPEGWYALLPGLQEPANYGTKFETGIYEEYEKSGYRLSLHPFALRFFEHYHMAPGQLVPNGWRKLVGLIYLVQTSGYKPDATDFVRVFFEICFFKGVANCPGWYYIHSRQRLLKGGLKSNKGWHSRYFFGGRLDKRKLPFDRDWNPYYKDFENPGKPIPNNLTKHILSHIKL